ncbi:MAG TPA: type I glutamate--ammonia ligase [Candidatus Polarisedimenticolia bacterium]|nr:type I glutamate--ammonia ligase [Candidatus Polarisedimenticolia bacterium]
MKKPADVLKLAKDQNVRIVDLRFMDLPGMWQHFSVPIGQLSESSFEDGFGFDGSSIRGFQAINESDLLVVPDAETAFLDPFTEIPTLNLICNIFEPITKQRYARDPRALAQRSEAYLQFTRIADTCYFGPEAEFFIFDDVRFDQKANCGYYFLDSVEGQWNSGKEEGPNLGHKPRHKEGYFPVPPSDHFQDLRSEMVINLERCGLTVEAHHHEVATGGQMEIDIRFNTLVRSADNLAIYKYVVKNTARRRGHTVTFMPKPLFGDNGSGMHCHQSLWKGGKNLFAGEGYGGFSEMGLHYIGGLLKHSGALAAIIAPTTNSYKRLTPGFEAPVNLAYSRRNRSAAIRIPMVSANPAAIRLEYRPPDPSANAYVAFAAMLMAGLDGIEKKMDPGKPLDKDIYGLSPQELKNVPAMPGSLEQSLINLEADHDFLLKGDVFTEDMIRLWIDYKREREVNPMRLRPHPYEFALYYDI